MYARMQAGRVCIAALIIACADAYHLGNGRGHAPFTRPSEVRRRRVFRGLPVEPLCRCRRCVECGLSNLRRHAAKCGTCLRRFSVCSVLSGTVAVSHPEWYPIKAYRATRSAVGSGVHHNEGSGPSSTTSRMNEMREVVPAHICTGTRPAPPATAPGLRPNGSRRAWQDLKAYVVRNGYRPIRPPSTCLPGKCAAAAALLPSFRSLESKACSSQCWKVRRRSRGSIRVSRLRVGAYCNRKLSSESSPIRRLS